MEEGERLPDGALSPDSVLAARIRVPQHVVFRAFPAETVVLNLDTGIYHSLNPAGGHYLEVLEQSASVREGIERLQAEFSDQDPAVVEADLRAFCVDLAERGLIELEGE